MRKSALIFLISIPIAGCVLQLPAPSTSATPPAQLAPPQISQPKPPKLLEMGDSVDGWVHISTIDQKAYQIQEGSFRFNGDTKGNTLAVVITRVVDQSSNDISLFQWSVPTEDCIAGRGALVAHEMQGNLIGQNEFVFGGGNLASLVAETICGVAVKAAKTLQQPAPKAASPKGQAI